MGEKGNNKTFAQTTIKPKRRATALFESKVQSQELVSKVKRMDEVYPPVSSAEVSKIVRSFVGSLSPEAEASGGTEKYERKTEAAKSPGSPERADGGSTPKRSTDDVLKEFDDLINQP